MGIKSLFFYEEEQAPTAPPPTPTMKTSFVPLTPLSANAEMVASIKNATLKRATPYTALLKAAEAMAKAIPDERQRLQAAYAVVATDSRSLDQISKAIDLHITDVDNEKLKFMQASQTKRNDEIGVVQSQLDAAQKTQTDLSAEYTNLQNRLQQIQTSMAENNSKITTLSTQVKSKDAEIAVVEKQFEAAVQQVKDEFDQQRKVILSTLK